MICMYQVKLSVKALISTNIPTTSATLSTSTSPQMFAMWYPLLPRPIFLKVWMIGWTMDSLVPRPMPRFIGFFEALGCQEWLWDWADKRLLSHVAADLDMGRQSRSLRGEALSSAMPQSLEQLSLQRLSSSCSQLISVLKISRFLFHHTLTPPLVLILRHNVLGHFLPWHGCQ